MAQKIESRQVLTGSTPDLSALEIHTSTLLPGESNHPLKANPDAEELIIIKEGNLKATVEDATKMLGPGGVILLLVGDKQSFINMYDKPATYKRVLCYSMAYQRDGRSCYQGRPVHFL